ncbi:MAG: pyridoxamine 5'-phosphate oxidase [Rickettsiales bacterium]|nr:pyridoxamine 5'-phosphate oxidase [Rickettsiales bacterium]
MKKLYGKSHRQLQDEFDSRKMADRLNEMTVKKELDTDAIKFIESRDMFFLSTIDHNNIPTVSYKGGLKGFVKVIDSTTIAFPSYDGNGMFMSMGNIKENNKVGILFICFEKPHRLRVHGEASISRKDPLINDYKEADLVVRVKLIDYWQNCPRYIHKYKKLDDSRYVPKKNVKTPVAGWKQTDVVQDVLPSRDKNKIKKEEIIPINNWMKKVKSGDPSA